jgi:hypothetical protein
VTSASDRCQGTHGKGRTVVKGERLTQSEEKPEYGSDLIFLGGSIGA